MQTNYGDAWSDISQRYDIKLWVTRWRSLWFFSRSNYLALYLEDYLMDGHNIVGQNLWPHIKCHWDLYFIVQWFCCISWRLFDEWTSTFYNEPVGHNLWPQNKCRSLSFIFQGPVIVSYILKIIWWMSVIFLNISVSHNLWPQNNAGHCYLYFMVQWVCLYLEDYLIMNIVSFDHESVAHNLWLQTKCRSLWPICNGPVILPHILKTIWWMRIKPFFFKWVSWHKLWPQNKYRSVWPIFHCSLILLYVLKTIRSMSIKCFDH